MKKLLLATLVTAASIGAAQADGPTVYGKINVSIDSTKNQLNTKSETSVDSNASRLGVKGSEKLTDKLSAIYGIEWGVTIDSNKSIATAAGTGYNTDNSSSGSTVDLVARNRYIGLQYEGLATLKVGRLDTNLKTVAYVNPAQGVDIFDDYVNGSFDSTQTFGGENRINNVIALESAKFDLGFGQVAANFLIAPSEKTVAKNTVGTTGVTATSSSVLFTNKDAGLYTGLAYDSNISSVWNATGTGVVSAAVPTVVSTSAGTKTTNAFRWVGSVDLGKLGVDGVTLNALAQQSKATGPSKTPGVTAPKETAYLVSGIYKFPASVLDGLAAKVQWQTSTTKDLFVGAKDIKIDQYGFDVDYAFSAKTKVYGFVAQRVIKNPNNPATAATGVDTKFSYTAFGIGAEQKF